MLGSVSVSIFKLGAFRVAWVKLLEDDKATLAHWIWFQDGIKEISADFQVYTVPHWASRATWRCQGAIKTISDQLWPTGFVFTMVWSVSVSIFKLGASRVARVKQLEDSMSVVSAKSWLFLKHVSIGIYVCRCLFEQYLGFQKWGDPPSKSPPAFISRFQKFSFHTDHFQMHCWIYLFSVFMRNFQK